MPELTNGKILGLVTPSQYVTIMYYLLIGSSGLGLLFGLLALMHVYVGIGGLLTLASVIALIKAILGVTLLQNLFTSLDRNHFTYVCIVFLAFLVVGMILTAMGGMISLLLSLIFSAAQLVLFFTGFNSWKHARMMSANNLQSEVRFAMKRS